MPRLVGERVEVLDRPRVRRDDLQHLAGGELVQRLLRLQDRQRAREPARVEFLVEVHGAISSFVAQFGVMPLATRDYSRAEPGRTLGLCHLPCAAWRHAEALA